MILDYAKILLLLWTVNIVPPVLAYVMGDRWNQPLDLGRPFRDGKPLLGSHKTMRGVLGGSIGGACAAVFMGMPWWVGLIAGILSMAGDLLSSFLKRRLSLGSGASVPAVDQGFEGALPFLALAPYFSLDGSEVFSLLLAFSAGAYAGSWFHLHVILKEPVDDYPRPLKAHVRMRELRACQMLNNPLRYLLNFEDAFYYHILMKTVFKALGIYDKGMENALEVESRKVCFRFPDLPRSFENYTILYMSDLHLDGLRGLDRKLQELVDDLEVDLCILGGDFRMETYGPFEEALRQLGELAPRIRTRDGVYGVLGNHDCLEMVKPLEKLGVNFLINDAKAIERNGERIWIVGIDDPHHFKCHDLDVAFEEVPQGSFSIFLAHSNEVYKEAARHGTRLYLCGHTHGGQIRVPLLGPVFTHSSAPRRLCYGEWRHGHMAGFTSCGVGVSGVPVRFSTKGEVLLVTLKR
ncbi:MAG: CDP-archaeol synthase [Syntrophobacteraceae bacterium]|nr:CDP-archaeol synthase [Syntrophobacteraceae bacterium]